MPKALVSSAFALTPLPAFGRHQPEETKRRKRLEQPQKVATSKGRSCRAVHIFPAMDYRSPLPPAPAGQLLRSSMSPRVQSSARICPRHSAPPRA